MSHLAERIAATRRTIASSAARLALDQGVGGTTVEQIIADADVGRSTFFRYFDSKELAIAEGLAGDWGDVVVEAIRRQPAELSAMDAVRSAFGELEPWFPEIEPQLLDYLRLGRESRTVRAWVLELEVMVEEAIAEAVTDRFDDVGDRDPRPRMVGAITLAASRHAMDRWLDSDCTEDLHHLFQSALGVASVA